MISPKQQNDHELCTSDSITFGINSFKRLILTGLRCETQLCVFYFQDAELRVLSTYSGEINSREDADDLKVKSNYCPALTTSYATI